MAAVRAELPGAEWVVADDGETSILVIDAGVDDRRAGEIEVFVATIHLPTQRAVGM